MKLRHQHAHMKSAQVYADLSYCNRKKVGAVIVNGDRIVSIGYNGTPSGADNNCEDEHNNTLPSVIHAEDNALRKLKGTTEEHCSTNVMFVTVAPCLPCAKLLADANITHIFFKEHYKNDLGISFLQQKNITIKQLSNDCSTIT